MRRFDVNEKVKLQAVTSEEMSVIPIGKSKAGKAQKEKSILQITLKPMVMGQITVSLIGKTGLICHHFNKKAIWELLKKQLTPDAAKEMVEQLGLDGALAAIGPKAKRDPQVEFLGSLYEMAPGSKKYGFPALCFKKAILSACKYVELSPTYIKGLFHVECDPETGYVPLQYDSKTAPIMRRDVVRLSDRARTPFVAFRGEFPQWGVTLDISFVQSLISPQQIITLLQYAGECVGVGERRPEKEGAGYGRFTVDEKVSRGDGKRKTN